MKTRFVLEELFGRGKHVYVTQEMKERIMMSLHIVDSVKKADKLNNERSR